MMLDMKRTFDEVVEAHADPGAGRADPGEPLLPVAVQLVRGHAGVHGDGEARPAAARPTRPATWDLIVVDTPPSRSALDFLDAPQRLGSFLDGRLIRLLAAPAKAGGRAYLRVLNAGFGMFTGILSRILGGAGAQATCRPSSPRSTRCSAASASGPTRPTGCCSARHRLPGRRRARAGRAARGVVLRGAAGRRRRCRWPASSSTGSQQRAPGLSRRARDGRRGDARASRRRHGTDRRRCCGCMPTDADAGRPSGSWRAGSRPRTRRSPVAEVPALAEDVHDLEGLRRSASRSRAEARWVSRRGWRRAGPR